jgi:hypothetical protein
LPYWISFVFFPILYGGLFLAFFLFGEAIDQPHPAYFDGSTWLTRGVSEFLKLDMVAVVAGMLLTIVVDAVAQRNRPRDHRYYPQLLNIWRGRRLLHVRLILIFGGLLIVGGYADSVAAVWGAQQGPHGLIWPPRRVFEACYMLWGMLWVADCASRPNGRTMAAAIGYLCLGILLPTGGLGGGGVLVE